LITSIFIFLIAFFTFAFIGFILISLKLTKPYFYQNAPQKQVIIPFRNEVGNLPQLLAQLNRNGINSTDFIFVNDHSTDESTSLLDSKLYKLIQNKEPEIGKKSALINGVKYATSEYLIFNDMDIYYPKEYSKIIEKMPEDDFDIGILPIWLKKEKGLFNKLMRLDFSQIVFATFSFKGNLGSGANLLVKKSSFLEYSSNYCEEILSGDDYFLIKEARRKGGKISYLFDAELIIQTKSPNNVQDLIRQRARWIKKSFLKGGIIENITSFVIFIGSLLPYVLLFSYISAGDMIYLYLLGFKIVIDMLILIPGLFVNKALGLIYLLPLLELIYPFYYIAVALGAMSKQKWKGRDI